MLKGPDITGGGAQGTAAEGSHSYVLSVNGSTLQTTVSGGTR